MDPTFTCERCGQSKPTLTGDNTSFPEYGTVPGTLKKRCWVCCGETEKKAMVETGRATLYLSGKRITNWPGTLEFAIAHSTTGSHPWARIVRYVRFVGPDDKVWTGRQVGDNTQILHCRRTKLKSATGWNGYKGVAG